MPATLVRVAFITAENRWNLQYDAAVASRHLRARTLEEVGFCTSEAGAIAVNSAVLGLLKGDTQIIVVPVDPLPEVTFDRQAPIATLTYEPLGIVNREMIVVGYTSEVKADGTSKGSLMLW